MSRWQQDETRLSKPHQASLWMKIKSNLPDFELFQHSDQSYQCSCSFVVEESEVSVRLVTGQSSLDLAGFGDVPPQPPASQDELAHQLLGHLQSPRHQNEGNYHSSN